MTRSFALAGVMADNRAGNAVQGVLSAGFFVF